MAHGIAALYPVFVDNTGNANVHHQVALTVMALVLSAYLLFGFPGGDTLHQQEKTEQYHVPPNHLSGIQGGHSSDAGHLATKQA